MTWSARSRLERAIRAVDQAVLFDLQLCMSAYAEQVAAAMRENAQKLTSLIDEVRSEKTAQSRTAIEDLKTYERFARAHEEGLTKLTAAFGRLYEAMPAAQKKTADDVFNSWQQRHEMHRTGEQQPPASTGQPG